MNAIEKMEKNKEIFEEISDLFIHRNNFEDFRGGTLHFNIQYYPQLFQKTKEILEGNTDLMREFFSVTGGFFTIPDIIVFHNKHAIIKVFSDENKDIRFLLEKK